MKPGYYLSEAGNFQIWYPKDHFQSDRQTLEVQIGDTEYRMHYTDEQMETLQHLFEFEFLGDL